MKKLLILILLSLGVSYSVPVFYGRTNVPSSILATSSTLMPVNLGRPTHSRDLHDHAKALGRCAGTRRKDASVA